MRQAAAAHPHAIAAGIVREHAQRGSQTNRGSRNRHWDRCGVIVLSKKRASAWVRWNQTEARIVISRIPSGVIRSTRTVGESMSGQGGGEQARRKISRVVRVGEMRRNVPLRAPCGADGL